ncbi:hypothetical protein [Nocardia tengchongensis]|uniref:hypothetical protein n=1 Tax=Nocardia tengchongensis TaxID=2055889 RepID=UPI003689E640
MADHAHEEFESGPGTLPGADPVLLGHLVSAAADECPSCVEALLSLIAHDAPTTAQLVELACAAVNNTLGGLPVDLVDTTDPDSPVPMALRQLVAARMDRNRATVNTVCASLSAADRHAAARTATALLAGEIRAAGHRANDGGQQQD